MVNTFNNGSSLYHFNGFHCHFFLPLHFNISHWSRLEFSFHWLIFQWLRHADYVSLPLMALINNYYCHCFGHFGAFISLISFHVIDYAISVFAISSWYYTLNFTGSPLMPDYAEAVIITEVTFHIIARFFIIVLAAYGLHYCRYAFNNAEYNICLAYWLLVVYFQLIVINGHFRIASLGHYAGCHVMLCFSWAFTHIIISVDWVITITIITMSLISFPSFAVVIEGHCWWRSIIFGFHFLACRYIIVTPFRHYWSYAPASGHFTDCIMSFLLAGNFHRQSGFSVSDNLLLGIK